MTQHRVRRSRTRLAFAAAALTLLGGVAMVAGAQGVDRDAGGDAAPEAQPVDEAGEPRTPPGRLDDATTRWASAIGDVELRTLPGPPRARYRLTPTPTHVYFVLAEYDDADDDDGAQPARDEQPAAGRRHVPIVPMPHEPRRRVIARVPADAAAAEERLEEVGELGAYPFAFEVLDGGERVVAVYQEPRATGAPAPRILRLGERTAEGWRWTDLYTGTPRLVLAGVLPRRGEALLVEPGEERFANRLLRLPLPRRGADAAAALPDEPREWARGLFIACVDEHERYAIVTRAGHNPAFARGRNPQATPESDAASDERLRFPPTVVAVPFDDPENERLLVHRQRYTMFRFVHDDIGYAESVDEFPGNDEPNPLMQARHSLAYYDLSDDEAATRVPMTGESRFNFRLIGPLPRRGVLYLRSTHINRHLHLFAGNVHTLNLRELSPLTDEFALAPDGSRLYFLEYAATARRPFNPMVSSTHIRVLDLRPPSAD